MGELIVPNVVERMKICGAEVRDNADEFEDLIDAKRAARKAVASIVPELEEWKGQELEVTTNTVLYSLPREEALFHIMDDPFRIQGVLSGGSVVDSSTALSETTIASEFELYLKFIPNILSDRQVLTRAESVLVPMLALRSLRNTCS